MAFTVYILKNDVGRFYTGYTQDLKARLAKHVAGATKTTRNKGPWQIVHTESFLTKKEATSRERELKKLKSRGIYESLR